MAGGRRSPAFPAGNRDNRPSFFQNFSFYSDGGERKTWSCPLRGPRGGNLDEHAIGENG